MRIRPEHHRLPRLIVLITVLCVAGALGGLALARSAGPSSGQPVRIAVRAVSPAQRTHSFLSLVPACGCNHTVLSAFSLTDGSRGSTIGEVSGPDDVLDTPATDAAGRVFFTETSGARCRATGPYMECPDIVPDSCVNRVAAVGPGRGTARVLFSVPGAATIGRAVPNPAGTRVVFSTTSCTDPHGGASLVLRNLSTGHDTPLAVSRNRCDSYNTVAWNAAGTRIAFPFDQARGTGGTSVGGMFCPGALTDRLVVASIGPSGLRQRQRLAPDPGCRFRAASFDGDGLVAMEGCRQGSPTGFSDTNLGHAYLLRFSAGGHRLGRLGLRLGLEQALAASIPGTDDVLITQDQPANNGTPEDDWVWRLHGGRLVPIRHYRARDAAQVIAVPW